VLSDQTVLEGGSAVFDCVSRGTPPLSVTWLHNAVPLAADHRHVRFNSKCSVILPPSPGEGKGKRGFV